MPAEKRLNLYSQSARFNGDYMGEAVILIENIKVANVCVK
jgi:hypothetical protein